MHNEVGHISTSSQRKLNRESGPRLKVRGKKNLVRPRLHQLALLASLNRGA